MHAGIDVIGLSSAEVAERVAKGQVNTIQEAPTRTVRQIEKVEIVFGGRWAPVENTAAGWLAISRSTGLPQRRKRGTSRSFMRATVTATMGSSSSQPPARSGRSPSAAMAPYLRRY